MKPDGGTGHAKQRHGMIDKQNHIFLELKKRITEGVYGDKLPKSAALAEEFGVNVKTIDKVMSRLVRLQMVTRKRRGGTAIQRGGGPPPAPVIEIIYEGSHRMEGHPYWMSVWLGLMSTFGAKNVTLKLNRVFLQPDRLIDLENLKLEPVSARLVIGIHEKAFFEILNRTKVPFLSVGDPVRDIRIPQIQISFRDAIEKTVDALFKLGMKDIAFLGRIYSSSDSGDLEKYNAWRDAMLRRRRISDALFEHAFLYEGAAYQATLKLLEREVPEILIAATDTQIHEIERALREKKVRIPVIGCDGVSLPGCAEARRPMPIQAPLFSGGQMAAENILTAIQEGKRPKSGVLEAKFIPQELAGLRRANALTEEF